MPAALAAQQADVAAKNEAFTTVSEALLLYELCWLLLCWLLLERQPT